MKITFAGAAREVTGSCHILEVGGRTVLLDCGMFQGRRVETRVRNAALPIEVERIDAVVLSHAHIDHSTRLPQADLLHRGDARSRSGDARGFCAHSGEGR